MPVFEVTSVIGGISSFEDRGAKGSFVMASNLDIRRTIDSIKAGQALMDIGNTLQSPSASQSPSSSISASSSISPSSSASKSPSSSVSPSNPPTSSLSPSASKSPSSSVSPSGSVSPSSSISFSPSPSSGLKTVWRDLIHFWVPCSDGNLYGAGNTGKVYKIDSDDTCTQVFDLGHEIKGFEEKPSAGGKTYLLMAGNTDLHRKEIPGNAQWNDVDAPGTVQGDTWPKTNLQSADWHTMRQVDGDVHIANGSMLALSAYDDSYTNEALDLIPGNLSKTLVERQGRVVIGTVRASDPNNGTNGAIDSEVPLAQVGNDGQIFYADFVTSVPVKRFPGGGKINPGGVCNAVDQVSFFDWELDSLSWIDKQVVGNMALFGVYNADAGKGGIYSYGREDKDHNFVLNLDFLLDVDEIGAIITRNTILYVSYRSGSSFGVKTIDPDNKAVGLYEALDFHAPPKKPTEITIWDQVELFMEPLPAGCSVEFWYKLNKTGDFIQAKLADESVSFTTANAKKAVFRLGGEGEIYRYRIITNPSGNQTPEIFRARTYFH